MTMSSDVDKVSVYQYFKRWWRRARQQRKGLQLILARALLDHRHLAEHYDPSSVKRLAVFRWEDKLGDCIMATRFVDAVSRARPDIEIVFITGKQGASLLSNWSAISEIVICGRRGWKTAWSLRRVRGSFDVVIELTSGMSAYELFALKVLKSRHYLGYKKQGYQLFDLLVDDAEINFADRNLAAAKVLTGSDVVGDFYIPRSSEADAEAADFFAPFTAKTKVLINLFAAGKHRSFTQHAAIDLLRWWSEQWPDQQLILLTVPGREAEIESIVGYLADEGVAKTPPKPSIAMSAAYMLGVDLVFTPDTAVAHIGAALNVPMIAVYRRSDSEFEAWRPASDSVKVLFNNQVASTYDRVAADDFSRDQLKLAVAAILD